MVTSSAPSRPSDQPRPTPGLSSYELLNDALTGRVAVREGMTVLTADRHFDLLQQLEPALNVVFYR